METMYVITGICGHLGNTIARLLCARGCRVRGFALPQDRTAHIVDDSVEMVYGDITSPSDLEPLFDGGDAYEFIVIHAAGIVSIASRFQQIVYDVNVGGTRNILSLCETHKVKRLIYISSVHAIPEKEKGQVIAESVAFDAAYVTGLYARTKAEATRLVLAACQRGLNACVVHPSGIIGPYDYGHGHLTQLILDYVQGRLTAAVSGGYDFVDVRDVAQGIVSCCENGESGNCYILSNRYFEMKELLHLLAQVTGKKEIKTYLPLWFAKLTAPLAETFYALRHQPPLYTAYSLYTLQSNACFSHEKADNFLRYTNRPMTQTLTDTVHWLHTQGRLTTTV